MKIAVTSTGTELASNIDPRFGRAAYFIIVNPNTMEYEVVENKQALNLPKGAGIQDSQTIVDRNVDVLITGYCGPKAFQVLNKAGIKILFGAQGRVIDAVQQHKNGEQTPSQKASVPGHWV